MIKRGAVGEFTVTMKQAEGISQEERRARLHAAYTFILSLRSRETADLGEARNQDPESAADALTHGEREHTGV